MERINILVIDDEQVICDGCHLMLSEKGHSIDICLNGSEGLNAVKKGKYDLILLDLKLPDIDGIEILRAVKKAHPNIYVVIMTGYSTVQSAVQAMKLGATDYLTKPFIDDALMLAVERVIEKKKLVEENMLLREKLTEQFGFSSIVGENPKILKIFDEISKVAQTNSTVLLSGESGTGKELFARAIHTHSQRAAEQFLPVDCSTLSPGLLESELFGHVKGAFTGAVNDKTGIFEMACDGTLFLDEIANLNMEIQGKLLRVLEMGEYKPVGSSQFKKTAARVIAATNQDLKTMVTKGSFREDLFYRINVFPIYLPPLRERRDDIPRLAYHFLRHFCRKMGKKIEGFSEDALEMLVEHTWPGNVRELKNVIERLVIMADHKILDLFYIVDHLQMKQAWRGNSIPETLDELKTVKKRFLEKSFQPTEKAFLINALNKCNGNITRAAEKVGMQRSNFSALMKKYKLGDRNASKEDK
jgi:DNA-binding NtrC family response regulator